MRLQLLLVIWFVLTAWSHSAASFSHSNCQTQKGSVESFFVEIPQTNHLQDEVSISSQIRFNPENLLQENTFKLGGSETIEQFFDTVLMTSTSAIAHLNLQAQSNTSDVIHQTHRLQPDKHHGSQNHDCCDEMSAQHSCSGNCIYCDGCTTAHHIAIPTLWLIKDAIAQQRIQYAEYSYLSMQIPTQERPPKH